jgi:hypothetical protein
MGFDIGHGFFSKEWNCGGTGSAPARCDLLAGAVQELHVFLANVLPTGYFPFANLIQPLGEREYIGDRRRWGSGGNYFFTAGHDFASP